MFIKFSQIFFLIFILYYGWFQIIFFKIPNMLLILGILIIGFIILDSLVTGTSLLKIITLEIFLWGLFAITSVIFGFFLVADKEYLFSSIFKFIQFIVLIYGMVYISNKKGSIDFFVNIFIILAIISALTTWLVGVEVGQGRISMGLDQNVNSLGITMVIGLVCILYKFSIGKFINSMISFSIIFLLIYVTILTGSRKSLLAVVLVIIYWLLFVIFKEIKLISFRKKVIGLISILIISIVGINIMYPFFNESVISARLINLFEEGSNTRDDMYSVAFAFFKDNPLVGIGYDNFRFISGFGTYSHSTYAEALAGTGLIGTFLYLIPYVVLVGKYVEISFFRKLTLTRFKQSRVMLGLMFVLLFLGFGVIHFYDMNSTLAFGMIIAFYNLNKK